MPIDVSEVACVHKRGGRKLLSNLSVCVGTRTSKAFRTRKTEKKRGMEFRLKFAFIWCLIFCAV